MVSHVGSRYVLFMSEIRIPAPREGRPQVKADIPSLVAEFLGELTLGDIIVELVQNELDGGSRRTEIEITDDALICTGDGEKIGPTGWERLSFVIGAGTLVEAKVDGIGVKNHGIRACFLLGDRIVVQSDKQRADLTARGQPDEPDAFFPAAWDPEPDPMAPKRGVRVTVPMRTEPLAIPGRNPLMPPTSGTLDELFNSAIEAAPDRFLCASTPGQPWRYELVFKRGKRTVSLTYTARSMGKSGLYERICTRAIGNRDGREVARRLTSPFVYLLAERDTAKVPRLFRDSGQVLGEICWRTNRDAWPMPGGGALRYPIAFPTEHVQSCWGFDISGPFVAGRARHSVGEDARNADIIATARRSFVELMRSYLVPRYGPAAVELALNIDHPDAAASNKLVAELVGAGALPLANDRPALKGVPANDSFQLIDPGKPLALPIARYAGGQLDAEIAKISRSFRDTLHQDVTPAIVRCLCAAPNSAEQTPEFDEVDAARSIFIENAPPVGTQNPEWLKRCVSVTRILERSRAHEKLTADELRTLKAAGRLPTDGCISVEWARMRRAKQLPPAIPGTKPPPLLHSTLARSSIFREGAGAVERFNLNQYVANVDFAQAESKARAAFFKWLRRGHDSLQPKTLATLARYPIWPGSDGAYRALDDYCWPSAEYLRRLLGEVQAAPASQLLSFPGLRRASNASLRLRMTPKWTELTAWHEASMERVRSEGVSGGSAAQGQMVDTIEAAMDRMRTEDLHPSQYAAGHWTLSRAGTLRPISELHVDGAQVTGCRLLDEDLTPSGRRALHLALGAQLTPLPTALLKVMRSDPDSGLLMNRLSAYKASGRPLSDLAGEAIVSVDGTPRQPGSLAFSATTDFWGEWKRKLPSADFTPDGARMLEEAGVVRSVPREDWSRAFFDWLDNKSLATQYRHLTQIVRHWHDRRSGLIKWAPANPNVACIPARDAAGTFSLLPLKEATRKQSTVFLPDFAEIQDRVLVNKPRFRLAIADDRDVDGSILHELKEAGVRSLRAVAGSPRRFMISGDSRTDVALDTELARMKSPAVRTLLPKLLPRHDVRPAALKRSWRRLLADIAGVRVAVGLHAEFELFGRTYDARAFGGFDAPTRQICVKSDAPHMIAFYDAIADYIFEAGSPPSYAHGLQRAVHDQAQESLFAQLDIPQDSDDPNISHVGGDIGNPGEANEHGDPAKGHGLPHDVNPFAPKPSKLEKLTELTWPKARKVSKKKPAPSSTDAQRHSLEEDAQINKLKNDHYAVHCQACIGNRDILEVTPPESYVYSPHYRRGLIQAHHVSHLQNEADGLGAQNLLILCQYHHQLLGDALTRAIVLESLSKATGIIRNFPTGADGALQPRDGLCAVIELPMAPSKIMLFFTPWHAKAWRDE
jgi:hypothetical protein